MNCCLTYSNNRFLFGMRRDQKQKQQIQTMQPMAPTGTELLLLYDTYAKRGALLQTANKSRNAAHRTDRSLLSILLCVKKNKCFSGVLGGARHVYVVRLPSQKNKQTRKTFQRCRCPPARLHTIFFVFFFVLLRFP